MFPKKTNRKLVTLVSIMVLASLHAQAYADPTWTLRTTDGPFPRGDHAMAYDSCRGVVVLYGGHDGPTVFEDTWEWDGSTWTQVCDACAPGPHISSAVAFDEDRCVTVLFGGSDGSTYFNDTWEWDGSSWTQRFPPSSPSPRTYARMAYDSTRGVMLLFGGYLPGFVNELWKWDGTTWTQVPTTSPRPSPRNAVGMAYDAARYRLVLFGGSLIAPGCIAGNASDETWELDMSTSPATWAQMTVGVHPSPRIGSNMVYDSTRSTVVLFGGSDHCSTPYGDTWEWTGSMWTEIPVTGPSQRCGGNAMAYDAARQEVVLFGGYSNCDAPVGGLGDTWVYGNSVPPQPPSDPAHRARKNRYISIDTTPNGGRLVAYEVTLSSMRRCQGDDRRACKDDADCPGVCTGNHDLQCEDDTICGGDGPCVPTAPCVDHADVGNVAKYVDAPYASSCVPLDDCTGQWFANLADTPLYRVWTEDILHITDCEIVPAATYDIRATVDGVVFSDPLAIGTIEKPQVHYGDCAGQVIAGAYTPPDGFTNVTDVQGYLIANQGGASAPHTTWVDLQGVSSTSICIPPDGGCVIPQQILNVGDLQTIKFGFLGQTYAETPGQENPGDCP